MGSRHLHPRAQRGAKANGGSVAEKAERRFLLQGNQTVTAGTVKEATGKSVLTASSLDEAPER
jgi:hypothetical protein